MTDQELALQFIADRKGKVDLALKEYFQTLPLKQDFSSQYNRQSLAHLEEFSFRPAKRIRSVLTMVSYEMYGGRSSEVANKAAIAVELIQDAFLIIDDVMDKSTLRRGSPTIHKLYQKELKNDGQPDSKHIGEMLAINTGLLADKLATQILNSIQSARDELVRKALQLFGNNTTRTLLGQIEDMYNNKHVLLEERQITEILKKKSSYYTFVSPLQVGAALANAKDSEIANLRDFGVPAGLVFQIQDDILGLFGDEKATGKSAESDVREGKITLMMRRAIDVAGTSQREQILETLGNAEATDRQISKLRAFVKECGALDYSKDYAARYIGQAREALEKLTIAKQYRKVLSGLLDYIISRRW